jgi:hypothetical protein
MPGRAQLIVASTVLLTLALTGSGVYLRFGRVGIILAGVLLTYIIVRGILEGIGTALLNGLLDRIWPGELASRRKATAAGGEADSIPR